MNHASKELYDKGTFTFSLDLNIADKKVPSKALNEYTFAMNGYRLPERSEHLRPEVRKCKFHVSNCIENSISFSSGIKKGVVCSAG